MAQKSCGGKAEPAEANSACEGILSAYRPQGPVHTIFAMTLHPAITPAWQGSRAGG